MELQDISVVNKLTILFFLDKMDVPLTDDIIIEVCSSINFWIAYMDCGPTLHQLIESGFIYRTSHDKIDYYNITPSGRDCISRFYSRVPASIRTEITEFVKENRAVYRRKQDYSTDYRLNPDKTYTCMLRIVDSMKTTLDLKINVATREIAKSVVKKWPAKAAQIYALLYEQLVD